jgi:nickel transport protein
MVPAGIGDLQKAALAEAVRNELKPLRREIIALKEKNDLQSVLGGIGYIVGLFGLWFFIAGRRLAKRSAG